MELTHQFLSKGTHVRRVVFVKVECNWVLVRATLLRINLEQPEEPSYTGRPNGSASLARGGMAKTIDRTKVLEVLGCNFSFRRHNGRPFTAGGGLEKYRLQVCTAGSV